MDPVAPVTLAGYGVRLEPLSGGHHDALAAAAADGELWKLWYTSAPAAAETSAYLKAALAGQAAGHMLPWAVVDADTETVVGTTRFHDIVPAAGRVEIGYTWYAARAQRTHVNSACKMLLLAHAFDTLRCDVVGLRTDRMNQRSQRAIERLGAQRDGIIRHHLARPDGTVRDTVMYSILRVEWPDVSRLLAMRLTARS